jgi:hypothetical protein
MTINWPTHSTTPKRRYIPDAPPGNDWFQPAGGTKFAKGDFVRIRKVGPYRNIYAQVLSVWAKTNKNVLYNVITIEGEHRSVVRALTAVDLEDADLNAMEIIALQARSNPPG